MSNRRILVIDDESDIREVTKMALEVTKGWTVLTAASGSEGIQTASEEAPDAILLDLMMPIMDGFATLELLRADERVAHIPVILFTAKDHRSAAERAAEVGDVGLIEKPFDPLTLGDQVAGMLGWES